MKQIEKDALAQLDASCQILFQESAAFVLEVVRAALDLDYQAFLVVCEHMDISDEYMLKFLDKVKRVIEDKKETSNGKEESKR